MCESQNKEPVSAVTKTNRKNISDHGAGYAVRTQVTDAQILNWPHCDVTVPRIRLNRNSWNKPLFPHIQVPSESISFKWNIGGYSQVPRPTSFWKLLKARGSGNKPLISFLKKIYIKLYVCHIVGSSTFIENIWCSHDSGRFVFNCMCASSGLPGRQINDACAISAQLSLILASSQFYVIVMAIALTLAIRNNIITIVF